jgi:lysyl-tRNA synthetase, class II
MATTEELFHALHTACEEVVTPPPLLQGINWKSSGRKFQQRSFIPTLIQQIQSQGLPDFQLPGTLSEHSLDDLKTLFAMLKMPLPAQPSTTRLLDVLASRFIEPLCTTPTFVTGYPAVMSPLAKSYIDTETGQVVSARAELFVNGTEYINMYEEENDPFAQTKKFLLQKVDASIDINAPHEELVQLLSPGQRYYVKVLEMGLPPTGGWGCGIERFTMLFGGAQRIGDVLPFGTLRNVVAMGTGKGSENQ